MKTDKYNINVGYNIIKINDRYTDMEIEDIRLNNKQFKILYGYISLLFIDGVPFEIILDRDMNISYKVIAKYIPNSDLYIINIYKLYRFNIVNHIIIEYNMEELGDFVYEFESYIDDDLDIENGCGIEDIIYEYMLLYTK